MVSLRDIGPLRRTVNLRGTDVQVGGITARAVVMLIDRFPTVRQMLSTRGTKSISIDEILRLAPEVLAAIAVAGMGNCGNEEEEKIALDENDGLNIGEFAEIIMKMLEITFEKKRMDHLEGLVATLAAAVSAGTGRVQATRLPSHLTSAFGVEDTHPKSPGTTPSESSTGGQRSSLEENLQTEPTT